MKNVSAQTVALALAMVASGNLAQAKSHQPLTFLGIDQIGLASVFYQGTVYHLTVGDLLAGETVVSIEPSKIVVKMKHHRRSVLVTIPVSK